MIYLDSRVVIHAVERRDDLGDRVRARLDSVADGLVVSPLVIHECLMIPLRRSDDPLVEQFRAFFSDLSILDLDLSAFLRAAELRAATPRLRVPDALHLAAAQLAGCEALWTNDRRLFAVSRGLAVDVLGEESPTG